MLLNGWKEIAIYLRSGIRTVQRWEALGLPTMRLRSGNRGPVVARTENLDAWLSARSLKNKGRTRPDLQATFSRVAAVRARAMEEMRVLLQNEWRIAVTMAEQALRTRDVKKAERLTAMARQAYDSILRLSLRMNLSGEAETLQFKKDLDSLKGTLRKLGDDF